MEDKLEIIDQLAEIQDVIFVGGTSEYLQSIKNELRDIDVVVTNLSILSHIGWVFKIEDYSIPGLNTNRGYIRRGDIVIDIFVTDNLPEYVKIGKYKCQTVQSMVILKEDTLEKNQHLLTAGNLEKVKQSIKRLRDTL